MFHSDYGMSAQFDDVPGFAANVEPDLIWLMNYFQTHRPSDLTTFALSLKKRIAPSSVQTNVSRHRAAGTAAAALFESWCQLFGLRPWDMFPLEPELWEAAIHENNANKLSKGLSVLAANDERSDPEWLPTEIRLFLKSQDKAKAGILDERPAPDFSAQFNDAELDLTRGAQAKAGQIITCLSDQVVDRLGPVCRYLDTVMRRHRPDNLWFHNKVTPKDLDDWVRGLGKDATPWGATTRDQDTECDFAFFDQSQNEIVLAFEEMVFRLFGISEEDISFYVELALTSRTFLGVLPVMRFSGQPFTLGGNSNFTAAYMNLRYTLFEHLQHGKACYCGDDFASDGPIFERPEWLYYEKYFDIVAKIFQTANAGFCSYTITPDGIFKSPVVMNLKLHCAKARSRLHDVVASYYLEHSFLHSNFDELLPYLSEAEVECHQENNRVFIAARRLIGFFSIFSPTFMQGVLGALWDFRDRGRLTALLKSFRRGESFMVEQTALSLGICEFALRIQLTALAKF
jgi:hypothetical protein